MKTKVEVIFLTSLEDSQKLLLNQEGKISSSQQTSTLETLFVFYKS